MNKTLNLISKLSNPSTFLLVWRNDNLEEYYCQFIRDKDYETAEYAVLQIISKTGINNAVLYKSAVKASKINNSTYRAYVSIAYYNGNLYNLKREKHMFAPPICIYRDGTSAWTARYERKNYYELLSDSIVPRVKDLIDANANRVYGKNWRDKK